MVQFFSRCSFCLARGFSVDEGEIDIDLYAKLGYMQHVLASGTKRIISCSNEFVFIANGCVNGQSSALV